MTVSPHRRLFLIGLFALTLAAGSVLPAASAERLPIGAPVADVDPYLARQEAALLPEFRDDVRSLASAPRYSIEAALDVETATLEGILSLEYTNASREPLSELVFRLLPNGPAIYGGGRMAVGTATRDGAPVEVELEQSETVLRFPLQPSLQPSQTVSVTLEFADQIPSGFGQGYGIFAQTDGVTRLSGWYPVLTIRDGDDWHTPEYPIVGDAMLADIAFYEVALDVPAGHTVASTGIAESVEERGKRAIWHLISGPARDFAVAVSDRFELVQGEADGVTVNFYHLPMEGPAVTARDALGMAESSIAAFSGRIAPYPLTEFDVVEAPITIGGYEFMGLVFMDDGLRGRGTRSNYYYIMSHEAAHQWWYGLVGNDQVAEPWLDEALAPYSSSVCLDEICINRTAVGLVSSWRQRYGERAPGDPPVNSPATRFTTWSAYRNAVYIHGTLFLDELRAEMGTEAFFEFLQAYFQAHRYGVATTEDFLTLAQETAGEDLSLLIERWFG